VAGVFPDDMPEGTAFRRGIKDDGKNVRILVSISRERTERTL